MASLFFQSYFIEIIFKLSLVVFTFLVVKKILLPFVRNNKRHEWLTFYLPVFRNVLFVVVALEMLIYLGTLNPLLTLAITGGIIVLLWNYIKEVFQGIVFKFQRGNIIGQRLKIKAYSGKIINLNNTKLELETDKGEILQIPYSKIIGDVEIKPSTAKYLKSCSMNVKVPAKYLEVMEAKVQDLVASLPYVIDSVMPKLEVVSQSEKELECKIVVFTNDEKYIPQIKSKLLNLKWN